jgi:hypothetical protein
VVCGAKFDWWLNVNFVSEASKDCDLVMGGESKNRIGATALLLCTTEHKNILPYDALLQSVSERPKSRLGVKFIIYTIK